MSFAEFQEAVLLVAGEPLLWLGSFWLGGIILFSVLLVVLALVRRARRVF